MKYRTLLAACAAIPLLATSAHARGANDTKACQRYREEHPGFLGAFDVTAHKAAWNGGGFDDETRQFTCPAAPGGESVAPMRIEKIPSHRRAN